ALRTSGRARATRAIEPSFVSRSRLKAPVVPLMRREAISSQLTAHGRSSMLRRPASRPTVGAGAVPSPPPPPPNTPVHPPGAAGGRGEAAALRGRLLDREHAELGLLDGRVVSGREGEREHRPRLRRVEHAVVPEPRGRIVGVSLELVLLPRRPLELLDLGLGHPGLSGPRELLLLHGRED